MRVLAPVIAALLLTQCAPSQLARESSTLSQEHVAVVIAFYDWFYFAHEVPLWEKLAAEVNGVPPSTRNETQYFVQAFKADPPRTLLAALARDGAIFLRGSEFVRGNGLRFYVDRIEFKSATMAVLEGGHWFHEMGARHGAYELVKKQGRWTVARTIKEAIS